MEGERRKKGGLPRMENIVSITISKYEQILGEVALLRLM